MLDGPATFMGGVSPAQAAAFSSAQDSGESAGNAYGGHRVVTATRVSGVPGHAAPVSAAVVLSTATAAVGDQIDRPLQTPQESASRFP